MMKRNIGFLLLAQGINVGSGLLIVALSARYLGVERFGQYTVLASIALFALPLFDGGLRINIVREIGRDPEAAPVYLGNVLVLRWAVGAGAVLVAAVVVRALPLDRDLEVASYAAILLGLAGLWDAVPRAVFTAYERNEYNVLMSIAQSVLAALATVVAIHRDTGVAGILAASALPRFAVAQVAQLLIHRYLVRPELGVDLGRWRGIIRSALPLGLSGLLRRSYSRIDVWLLAGMKGTAAAATFSLAYRVAVELLSSSRLIATALLPRLALLARARRDQLRTAVERLLLLLLVVSVPIAGTLAACAAPLLGFIAGPEFGDSVAALRLIAVVCVTALPDALLFFVLVALRKEMAAMACLVTAVIVNVALDVVLIPPFGVRGACFGTTGAEWSYFIMSFVLVCRELRITALWRFLGKPLVAGAAMAVAVWVAGADRPLAGAVGGLAAFALPFFLLRTLPREYLRDLRRALAVGPGGLGAGAEPLGASPEDYE